MFFSEEEVVKTDFKVYKEEQTNRNSQENSGKKDVKCKTFIIKIVSYLKKQADYWNRLESSEIDLYVHVEV